MKLAKIARAISYGLVALAMLLLLAWVALLIIAALFGSVELPSEEWAELPQHKRDFFLFLLLIWLLVSRKT
jgi:intracellular septation protein A